MTDASMIDPEAVAAALLKLDPEVADGHGGEHDVTVKLPDGRTASLRVVFDSDSGIGKGDVFGGHHDDVFGEFAWRGRIGTDHRDPRPSHFDGRARVLRPRDNGARIGQDVWWQPPADVSDDHLPDLERAVRAYAETGDWFHVGLVVTVTDPDGDAGGEASLWGVEWGDLDDPTGSHADHLRSTVADLLAEANIGKASTAVVPRWARDSVEAVAHRLDGDDSTVRALVAWWESSVEARGDWDTFAGPMTDAMESDFVAWRERMASLPTVDIDAMTDGYIDAALWADCMPRNLCDVCGEEVTEESPAGLMVHVGDHANDADADAAAHGHAAACADYRDESGGLRDLRVDAETWSYVRALVGTFAEQAGDDLRVFVAYAGDADDPSVEGRSSLAGHCLRLNSGGHGVGFWDREPAYSYPDPRLDEFLHARAVLSDLASRRPFDRTGGGDVWQADGERAEFDTWSLDADAAPGARWECPALTSAQRQAWIDTGRVPAVEDTFPVGP